MSSPIPSGGGRPKPGRDNLPLAKILENIPRFDGTPCLVLRVNIEGRDHELGLTIDELDEAGLSGPAGVEELRKIRKLLEQLVASRPETE
ncbi:MAG: hypothetical protein OXG15_12535 [Gammaproteobacteria bacterium]|nr:hypothetical protein [Gammaproteobacteria bacterium]